MHLPRVGARAATVALLSLGLAVPAVAATAKDGTYKAAKGQVQRGYDLKFRLSGHGTRITNLVAHVLESCAGEDTSSITTVGPGLTWKVKGGRFSGRKKEASGGVTLYTTLEGRISGSTAKGIVRQESVVAGAVCDTYELKFTAKRG